MRNIKTFCSSVRTISESVLHKLDSRIVLKFDPGRKPKGGFWHMSVEIRHQTTPTNTTLLLKTSIMPTLSEVQGDGDGGGTGGHRWCYNFAVKLIEQGIDAYMRSPVYEARMKNHVSEVLRRLAKEEAA